jgi:anti-anti-sigma factor
MMIGNTAIISVQGHLAIDNIDGFEEAAQKAISETSFLVMNLERAVFLDSSAIGRLVGLANMARRSGGELSLVAVSQPVQETLTLLNLDKFFPMYTHIHEALKVNARLDREETSVIQVRETDFITKDDAKWTIVRGPRRLDGVTSPKVVEKLSSLVPEKPNLVLDLSETVCLTSAGLVGLVDVTKLAILHNGELKVVTQSEDLLKVIKLGKFDSVLSLYTDLFSATA